MEMIGYSRVVIICLALGVATYCVATGGWQVKDLKNPTEWVMRDPWDWMQIASGLFLAGAAVVVAATTREPSKTRPPRFIRRFQYIVYDVFNRETYAGKAIIECDGVSARLNGYRCFFVEYEGEYGISKKCYLPWESVWTSFDPDWLRCEYRMPLFQGYLKVPCRELRAGATQFEGLYYLFPGPDRGSAQPDVLYGTIRFFEVKENEYDYVKPPL